MSNRQLRRNLRLLASTSAVALALTAAPVSVRVLPNAPAWHFEAPLQKTAVSDTTLADRTGVATGGLGVADEAEAARRLALERLGLSEATTYTPPVVLTLSRAVAGSGGGDGDGDGGGDGDGDGGGESGGDDGSGSGSGASGASSGASGASGSEGSSGGSFGDVEQVGPSLSQDEEAIAIGTGWQ